MLLPKVDKQLENGKEQEGKDFYPLALEHRQAAHHQNGECEEEGKGGGDKGNERDDCSVPHWGIQILHCRECVRVNQTSINDEDDLQFSLCVGMWVGVSGCARS